MSQSQDPKMLRVIEDIMHLKSSLLRKIRHEITEARRSIEGIVTDEMRQGFLFPELVDEIQIPQEYANLVIKKAQSNLIDTGVELKREGDLVRLVTNHQEHK